jgi:uncharacterized protein (DUF849 family)
MLLQACLNGSRKPGEHPALPLTAQELAQDAQRVVAVGAGALHIHPRNAQGEQSLDAQNIAAALLAIRARCPGVPVGVSTALWIEPDVERRLQQIQRWTVLPDYASVNFSEPGTAELCEHLLSRRVGIEAGIWSVEDAYLLLKLGLADRCLRILIEVQEAEVEAAQAAAEAILRCLDERNVRCPRLLHGDATLTVWPMLEMALRRGYDTRIGLEDTLTLPDGQLARDNAELVALAVRKAQQVGALLKN